jgi:hypothetical protein
LATSFERALTVDIGEYQRILVADMMDMFHEGSIVAAGGRLDMIGLAQTPTWIEVEEEMRMAQQS